jgi:hypothetical protein
MHELKAPEKKGLELSNMKSISNIADQTEPKLPLNPHRPSVKELI